MFLTALATENKKRQGKAGQGERLRIVWDEVFLFRVVAMEGMDGCINTLL